MDIEYFIQNPKGRCLESHVRKRFSKEYQDILKCPGQSFAEKLLRYFNPTIIDTCVVCGAPTKFKSFTTGFCRTCSNKCATKDPERISKILQTKQERYNDSSYNNRSKFLETMKGTNWGFKDKSVHEKIEQKYGVKNISQLDTIQKKKEETTLSNYGVKCMFELSEVQEKAKDALISKYGVDSVFKLDEYKDRSYKENKAYVLKAHPEIIDVLRDNTWVGACPHIDTCNKCTEKIYYTRNKIFNDRARNKTEQCTKLLPIGKTNQQTTIELFVRNILDEHNIHYKANIKSIIYPKELDIYLPDLKIAIECNGVYWHSYGDKKRHNIKYNLCKEQGIQLLTIWEDWIKTKPEIVKSIILSKLGIYKTKIGARQCIIKEISIKECQQFLESNHIQGRCKSNIRFGLYYNDKLISVMVFKKNKQDWELTRYCCQIETQIVGGAKRMLDHFIKEYSPNRIVSFSSNDISNGNLYKSLGFSPYSENIPYWYISQSDFNRYHRESFNKSNLKKLGFDHGTEEEIMSTLPYFKIYDSGMVSWEYIPKNN